MRATRSGQELAPCESAESERNEVEQGYGDQAPTDHQHCVSHLRGAAADNQVDHQREAENRGDDQRTTNDLAPMSRDLLGAQ